MKRKTSKIFRKPTKNELDKVRQTAAEILKKTVPRFNIFTIEQIKAMLPAKLYEVDTSFVNIKCYSSSDSDSTSILTLEEDLNYDKNNYDYLYYSELLIREEFIRELMINKLNSSYRSIKEKYFISIYYASEEYYGNKIFYFDENNGSYKITIANDGQIFYFPIFNGKPINLKLWKNLLKTGIQHQLILLIFLSLT